MLLEALALSVALIAPQQGTVGQEVATGRAVAADQEVSVGEIVGTIRGRHAETSRPLPHASLEVISRQRSSVGYADSIGGYRLVAVPSGPTVLRVHHVGYAPLTVEVVVPAGETLRLDLDLEWRPIALPPLLVLVDPLPPLWTQSPPTPAEIAELSLRAMEASPGLAEAGLAAVARNLPGSDPAEPSDVLILRGSAADA